MQLSLADAANALGQSQRQLRYLIQKGGLKARKQGGRWLIDGADLPLSEGQRQALAVRAAQARQALDKGLAPLEKGAKGGKDDDKRHYSVTDFRAYQAGMALLRQRIAGGALRLLDHLSLALAGFDRRERLAAADAELQTLRSQLLLGVELEVIGEPTLLAFAERAEAIGRQIGGWRKKLEREA